MYKTSKGKTILVPGGGIGSVVTAIQLCKQLVHEYPGKVAFEKYGLFKWF